MSQPETAKLDITEKERMKRRRRIGGAKVAGAMLYVFALAPSQDSQSEAIKGMGGIMLLLSAMVAINGGLELESGKKHTFLPAPIEK